MLRSIVSLFKRLIIHFKNLNLGVKRLLWSIYFLITVVHIYLIFSKYKEFKYYDQWTTAQISDLKARNIPLSSSDQLTYNVDSLWKAHHLFSEEYPLSLIIFNIGFWGLLFFALWIREGFQTKKQPV